MALGNAIHYHWKEQSSPGKAAFRKTAVGAWQEDEHMNGTNVTQKPREGTKGLWNVQCLLES